ncbi:MAG: hypothetical protein ICV60_05265 [Pyrinomonadaceae bacterium]|nr:hypothetical protein [Pyrinomonadaceae bacterium]
MNSEKPQFKLSRVSERDAGESPEIVSVNDTQQDAHFNRRGFLGAGISAAAAALFVSIGYERTSAMPFLKSINASLKTAGEGVMSLGITPDGKNLVSISDSDTISLWSLPDAELLSTRSVDKSLNNAHAFKEGGHGQKSNADHFMMLALSEGSLPAGLRSKLGSRPVSAITVTPDGSNLACAAGKDIYMWSLSEDRTLAERKLEAGDVELLAMTSNGKTLAAVSSEGAITVWNNGSVDSIAADELSDMIKENEAKSTGEISKATLQAVALSPDGQLLTAGFSNGKLLFLNLAQTRRRRRRRRRSRSYGSSSSSRGGGGYRVRSRGSSSTRTVPCGTRPGPGEVCTCNCM